MKRLIVLFIFLSLFNFVFSQEKQPRSVSGVVYDRVSKEPMEGVLVTLQKYDRKTFSDSTGFFSLEVIKTTGRLSFSYPGYLESIFFFHGPHYRGPFSIFMNKPETDSLLKIANTKRRYEVDSAWDSRLADNKNALYGMPFELITGSIGIQYERFLGIRQSLGLHTSFYVLGWGYSVNNKEKVSNKFTGLKADVQYRQYLKNYLHSRFFIEARLSGGYFNLHPLLYKHYQSTGWFSGYNETVGRNVKYYTGGIGVSFGWAIAFHELKKGMFNVGLGLQFFPILAPANTHDYYYDPNSIYRMDNLWWYIGGPGSIFVIRLAYGGIF